MNNACDEQIYFFLYSDEELSDLLEVRNSNIDERIIKVGKKRLIVEPS